MDRFTAIASFYTKDLVPRQAACSNVYFKPGANMPTSFTSPSQFAGMGANIHNGSCSFRLWAPNAREISLIGDFNAWKRDELLLFHEGNGYWSIDVPGASAGQEYKFKITNRADGADNPGGWQERGDPCSYDVPSSDTNSNSIIVDVPAELQRSGLTSDAFSTPSASDLILYQVHVGSF